MAAIFVQLSFYHVQLGFFSLLYIVITINLSQHETLIKYTLRYHPVSDLMELSLTDLFIIP